jgi:PPOX class probable F420-dependent enzyme
MNFTDHPYLSLRTFRRSGKAVDTPVWFASADPSTHYVFSAADAGKVKRIRNSSAAQIASCDMRGGSLGEWHDGHAYLVTDETELERMYALLDQKYKWQMRLTNFFSRLSGRINKRAGIRIEAST